MLRVSVPGTVHWWWGGLHGEVFLDDVCCQTVPFYNVVYYILSSGGFVTSCFRPSRTSPPSLDTLADTYDVEVSTTWRPPSHTEDKWDLLYFVPSRTPRNSWYGVLCICDLCYMLFLLYDVDTWHGNVWYPEDRGLQVPMVLDHDYSISITYHIHTIWDCIICWQEQRCFPPLQGCRCRHVSDTWHGQATGQRCGQVGPFL